MISTPLEYMAACGWCTHVTGMVSSCNCRKHCGAPKCPVDLDPLDDWYGYLKVEVPTFRKKSDDSE